MEKAVHDFLSRIGRKGGLKSRRSLDAATAKRMVRLRETRRAYIKFHVQCFWSFRPDLRLTYEDIPWVAEQLMKNGGRQAWAVGAKLCR